MTQRSSWTLAFCLVLIVALPALADRSYTVRDGDTLASIAQRHHIAVATLRAANSLRGDRIRPGQSLEIPRRGVVVVRSGDTLSRLARRHGVSVADLRRTNRLRRSATLRPGQRLRLPGVEEDTAAEERWGRPRRPGFVDLTRLHTGERLRMTLVDRRGRVRRAALRRLGRLMQSHRRGTRVRRPHRRLVSLLAKISDHFGGRRITVVSGFRSAGGYTRATSKHTSGRAIDFRIRGVPNTVLRDYCRRFSKVGVGYYPRSTFVHLDVRDRSAYWVDRSRPGQAPQYQRRSPNVGADDAQTSEGTAGDQATSPSTTDDASDETTAADTPEESANAPGPANEGTATPRSSE